MIGRIDTRQALTVAVITTIKYPLSNLTLIDNECEYIMAPAFESGLLKASIYKSTCYCTAVKNIKACV